MNKMDSYPQIKVLIVDDHAVVRSGLSAFFTALPDLELVGEAENAEEAIIRAGLLHPDVILMDLVMPGMGGVTATKIIKERYPDIHVIVLTSFQEDTLIQNALQAGAIGYLTKNISARELADAIRSAAFGKMTLSPEVAQSIVQHQLEEKDRIELTAREREILKLMVDGLNNGAIAAQLFISISTVKYHISNILSKLGVENRVAAVTTAIQKKLL